jgi:glutathione S-transferase
MLKIYGYENTRSLRALWAAAEAGLEYEYIRVDLARGEARDPTFVSMNPAAKVPVLVHGELQLCESFAICDYLGRIANANLVPAGVLEHARYLQWCSFAVSELEQPIWTHAKHTFVLGPKRRVPAVLEVIPYEFEKALATFATGLSDRPYILGERLSIADILLAHTLWWAQRREFAIGADNVRVYLNRLMARPAFTSALARQDTARRNPAAG